MWCCSHQTCFPRYFSGSEKAFLVPAFAKKCFVCDKHMTASSTWWYHLCCLLAQFRSHLSHVFTRWISLDTHYNEEVRLVAIKRDFTRGKCYWDLNLWPSDKRSSGSTIQSVGHPSNWCMTLTSGISIHQGDFQVAADRRTRPPDLIAKCSSTFWWFQKQSEVLWAPNGIFQDFQGLSNNVRRWIRRMMFSSKDGPSLPLFPLFLSLLSKSK